MSPDYASTITIPFCILPSKDEDQEICSSFADKLKVDKHVETFTDMDHGWMAAR
jgi:hypothetical protein